MICSIVVMITISPVARRFATITVVLLVLLHCRFVATKTWRMSYIPSSTSTLVAKITVSASS